VSDETTPTLTAAQITAEDANRKAMAAALAARTAAFEKSQQPVAAVAVEPKTPLAATLARLSAPAPIAPPRDLASTQTQLAPMLAKARALVRRFDALREEIGEKAQDYAQLDMKRITQLIPPTTDSENWARLNSLVNAARDIVRTFTATNYSDMARLIGIVQQFADGTITEYQDPQDRSRALYNPGVCIRYMGEQTARFLNCVNALANNVRLITAMEPMIAADLLVVTAAQVTPEPAPERLPMNQRLPNERPTSYLTPYDPRDPEPQRDDSVKVEPVADGFHAVTTRRPTNG
jgi:hypothetical protein